MRRKLIAVATFAATAALLAAVAGAGPSTTKQRVEIQWRDSAAGKNSFVLLPLSRGAIKRDSGTVEFCCWTVRSVIRDGQNVDINNPQMTLNGKNGTLVTRNQIGFVDLPDNWAVATGTWKVIRGTGAYAGLAGGGRGASAGVADGSGKAQFQGYLYPR